MVDLVDKTRSSFFLAWDWPPNCMASTPITSLTKELSTKHGCQYPFPYYLGFAVKRGIALVCTRSSIFLYLGVATGHGGVSCASVVFLPYLGLATKQTGIHANYLSNYRTLHKAWVSISSSLLPGICRQARYSASLYQIVHLPILGSRHRTWWRQLCQCRLPPLPGTRHQTW